MRKYFTPIHLFLAAYSLLAFVAFALISLSVHLRPEYFWDYKITGFITSFTSPAAKSFLVFVSWFGLLPQILLIIASILVGLLFFRQFKFGAIFAFLVLFAALSAQFSKDAISRLRPESHLYLYSGVDQSFPSGHVVLYTVIFGFMGFLALQAKPSLLRLLSLASVLVLIAFVGPSRIYIGHHWPSDVLAGYLLGSAWLAIAIFFCYRPHNPERPLGNRPSESHGR